ncbi:MAG: dihydrodipicolinate synthase family protein, partial [Lachnospiraceae bacterium]|nr:dihydrodipicolinate synthase family protein [Lachnospiraceae bacterium]
KQIEDQINAGASGILCMGSMGIEPYIRVDVFPRIVEAAVEAVNGRVPLLVGAGDTSIARIKAKIDSVAHLDFYGLVFTPSFFEACSDAEVINFYKKISALTNKNIFLYDHPWSTQAKIKYDMVKELLNVMPNLKGIKTGDIVMCKQLLKDPEIAQKDFEIIFSGLDIFDIGYKYGLDRCLDGMPACTPCNTGNLFKALANDDYDAAHIYLKNIIDLRDLFVANDLWPCFTAAMNMLGYEGDFAPDYTLDITKEAYDNVYAEMKRICEI